MAPRMSWNIRVGEAPKDAAPGWLMLTWRKRRESEFAGL